MVCFFNVDELLLEFVDGGVTTGVFFYTFIVGVEMYGVREAGISCLTSFSFFFVGVV